MDCILTQRQNPKQIAAFLQEQRRGFTNTAQIMGMAAVAAHKRQALQQVFCSPDSLIGTNQQGWKRSVGINQQNAGANGVIGLGQVMRHSHLLKDVAPYPLAHRKGGDCTQACKTGQEPGRSEDLPRATAITLIEALTLLGEMTS